MKIIKIKNGWTGLKLLARNKTNKAIPNDLWEMHTWFLERYIDDKRYAIQLGDEVTFSNGRKAIKILLNMRIFWALTEQWEKAPDLTWWEKIKIFFRRTKHSNIPIYPGPNLDNYQEIIERWHSKGWVTKKGLKDVYSDAFLPKALYGKCKIYK